MSSFSPPERLLLGPGPSPVTSRVRTAMAAPTVGHLDPTFTALMDVVKRKLRIAFSTINEVTFPLSGPGSVGMEAAFVNLVEPGDEVVVCRNGVFGGRMAQVAERCGARVVLVDGPWGRAVDPGQLEQSLREHPEAKVVAFVHAETSTGALSDAEALAAVAHEHGCLTIVDAVTSLGGVELEVDRWGLDVVYSGTQKCLSCPPGLSPITFNEAACEVVQNRTHPVQSWFLDLGTVIYYWSGEGGRTYHHTAPVNAIYGLNEALTILEEEGLHACWRRHLNNHGRLVDGLANLGLELMVPIDERLPVLHSVRVPDDVDEAEVRRHLLADHDIEIGAGLGELAGKVWRIGLMGAASTPETVERCLVALGEVLGQLRNGSKVA
ncbi:MAG: alanine--glyoxylate aminotransferase [Thiotrichales bacterium]|nr:alanine--glyoxylate aminotransferase [Thiotrichales bacterium]